MRNAALILSISCSLVSIVLAAAFLLAGIGFAITLDDTMSSPVSHVGADSLSRAENMAVALFVVTGLAAVFSLLHSASRFFPNVHFVLRLLGCFITVGVCSYSLALLSLKGRSLDVFVGLYHVIFGWLQGFAR